MQVPEKREGLEYDWEKRSLPAEAVVDRPQANSCLQQLPPVHWDWCENSGTSRWGSTPVGPGMSRLEQCVVSLVKEAGNGMRLGNSAT